MRHPDWKHTPGSDWNRKRKHRPRHRKQVMLWFRRAAQTLTTESIISYIHWRSHINTRIVQFVNPHFLMTNQVVAMFKRRYPNRRLRLYHSAYDIDRIIYSVHGKLIKRLLRLKYYW